MKPGQLSNYLVYCIKNRFPVLMTGAPGVGKSDLADYACQTVNIEMLITHPVVSDPTDYKGMPFPNKTGDGAKFLPFGDLEALIKAKDYLIFFIDDLGQAPISVQAAIMQLVLARRINGHKISDKVTFIAATNRKEDKAGVAGIIEPLIRRFYLSKLEVDSLDWLIWAAKNDMPEELMAFIAFQPDMLINPSPGKGIENTYCPRTIAMLGDLINTDCPKDLFDDASEGTVGPVFSNAYKRFLELFAELPTVDSVINNPNTAKIPPDKASTYAFTVSLAKRMNENNISKITKYLYRLPSELNVCCMKMATSKTPDLQNTAAFIEHTEKMHKEIFQN
jgi:hypothetical protein